MSIRRDAVTAGLSIVMLTLLLGIAYPLLVTGVSQLAFPGSANGQKVYINGKLVGSKIIGQQFTDQVLKNGKAQTDASGNPVTIPDPRYFQTRPSATVPPHNAAATTFSNLGPNNVATEREIAANVKAYIALNKPYDPGLTVAQVPVDAANSSASGIDPDISIADADIQAHRVAAVLRLSYERVLGLVAQHTSGRVLGVFGEPGVNVLELNLALDRLTGGQ